MTASSSSCLCFLVTSTEDLIERKTCMDAPRSGIYSARSHISTFQTHKYRPQIQASFIITPKLSQRATGCNGIPPTHLLSLWTVAAVLLVMKCRWPSIHTCVYRRSRPPWSAIAAYAHWKYVATITSTTTSIENTSEQGQREK